MGAYTTVGGRGQYSVTIKKSEFIGYCARVVSEDEARAFVDEIRKKHADARHNVYAYVLKSGNTARYSDDKEPQGSAGLPVLGVIEKSGVTDTAIVVTRYFGGILLGVGGLARAYTEAARGALENAGIAEFSELCVFCVECSYGNYGRLRQALTALDASMDSVEFTDSVKVVFAVKKELAENAESAVTEACSGNVALSRLSTRFGVSGA